jgi:N-formylglutamate amidohydrolase
MPSVSKTVLTGTKSEIQRRLSDACRGVVPYELDAGKQLRALGTELASREGVVVTIVIYDSHSMELHVTLPSSSGIDPLLIARDKTGENCQVSWERWANVGDQSAVCEVAELVIAMLTTTAKFEQTP